MSEIGAMLVLASLLVSLGAAPYYFRKLHRYTEALEKHAPDTYEALRTPSLKMLGYNMSPSSTVSLLNHVWKKSYIQTNNQTVILAGEKAFKALVVSFYAMGTMFLGVALIMLSSASV